MTKITKSYKASDELDGLSLGTAKEERKKAKAWMDDAARYSENSNFWRGRASALWMVLDDISTLDDMCKSNDAAFRNLIQKHLEKRWKIIDMNDEGADEGREVLNKIT